MMMSNTVTKTTIMIIISIMLILTLTVQCKDTRYDTLPMGTYDSQREFILQCQIDCISATISGIEVNPIDREGCKRQCTKMRDTAIKDECLVATLSASVAICTSRTCVFAPRTLFPSKLQSFDPKHFLNLVAYCTKAGADPHMIIPDFENDRSLTAQLLRPIDDSRQKAFEILVEQLPESSPAVRQQFQVEVIRTHPDAKIVSESVARSYLRLSHDFDLTNKYFLSDMQTDFETHTRFYIEFDNSVFIPVYSNPELVWYPSAGDEKHSGSVDRVAELASDLVRGVASFFGIEQDDYDDDVDYEAIRRSKQCYIELVSDKYGAKSWLLSRGSQLGKSGYKLGTQTTFPIIPPVLIYSGEYLTNLCHKIDPEYPTRAISMSVDEYHYEFGLEKFPSHLPLVKIDSTQKTAIKFDF